jgi:hypothetical protein
VRRRIHRFDEPAPGLPRRRQAVRATVPVPTDQEPMMARDNTTAKDPSRRTGSTAPDDARPLGRDADEAARNTPSSQPPGDSAGSRAGSALGSASGRTGLADGPARDNSQGLTGAQGSGGADRGAPGQPTQRTPSTETPRERPGGDNAGTEPHYRPDEEAS